MKQSITMLSTLNGYKIGFDYGYYDRSYYLKRLMEEGIAGTFSKTATSSIQEDLLK